LGEKLWIGRRRHGISAASGPEPVAVKYQSRAPRRHEYFRAVI
jgi:hypothetical protein